jgi:hypothetical protein
MLDGAYDETSAREKGAAIVEWSGSGVKRKHTRISDV